eukprot:1946438-Prorocentrum_lima.AAC.1
MALLTDTCRMPFCCILRYSIYESSMFRDPPTGQRVGNVRPAVRPSTSVAKLSTQATRAKITDSLSLFVKA